MTAYPRNARPTHSVLIPVFNTCESMLADCFSSLFDQGPDLARTEVVVVDDGSDRATKLVLEHLLSQALLPKVRLLTLPKHRGLAQARNAGVDRSTGEWILLLDSDDVIRPGALAAFGSAYRDSADLVFSDHVKVTSDRNAIVHERRKSRYQRLHCKFKGTAADPLLHADYVVHCQAFRRSALVSIGGFREDLGIGEEVDAQLKVEELRAAVNFVHIPTVLYEYRDYPASMSHGPGYYNRLVHSVEEALRAATRRRGLDLGEPRRWGRAVNTNAPHYAWYTGGGSRVEVPWFDSYRMLVLA